MSCTWQTIGIRAIAWTSFRCLQGSFSQQSMRCHLHYLGRLLSTNILSCDLPSPQVSIRFMRPFSCSIVQFLIWFLVNLYASLNSVSSIGLPSFVPHPQDLVSRARTWLTVTRITYLVCATLAHSSRPVDWQEMRPVSLSCSPPGAATGRPLCFTMRSTLFKDSRTEIM